ncbi:MAG: branched-chain amino acid ABC transporter permease [Microthrixaceae bacterium]
MTIDEDELYALPDEVQARADAAAAAATAVAAAPPRLTTAGRAGRIAVGSLLFWGVFLYPTNILSPFTVGGVEANAASEAVIFAVIGLSLNVLIGYVGTISLGHQAFVGIGAFTSAYVVTEMGQEFWIAALVAALVGAAQAALLGAVSLRVTGLYFALITLSYGIMTQESIFQVESLTGGTAGQDAPRPVGFESDFRYYYLCLLVLSLVVFLDWRLIASKGGRALLALRENPRVAATWGINVKAYTVLAFAVSGLFAGLGGSLLAHRNTSVVANPFDFRLALVFIMMTVIGGLRNRAGVIVGSAFFALLRNGELLEILHVQNLFETKPISLTAEVLPLVLGPLLLLVTITLFPGGFGQVTDALGRWLRGGPFRFVKADKEVQNTDVRA